MISDKKWETDDFEFHKLLGNVGGLRSISDQARAFRDLFITARERLKHANRELEIYRCPDLSVHEDGHIFHEDSD